MSTDALKMMRDMGLTIDQAIELLEALSVKGEPADTPGARRTRKYRERLSATGLSQEEWRLASARIIARDGAVCQYCGTAKGRMCCDHVVPLIGGGDSGDDNLVCACESCNGGKSGRSLEEWKGAAWVAAWSSGRVMSRDVTESATPPAPLPLSPQTPQTPTPTPPDITTREARAREEAAWIRFWTAYPRKVCKAEARKAFARAWKKLPPLDEEAILFAGLERAMAGWVDPKFTPHAATWLNGERWADEAEVIQLQPRKAHERPQQPDRKQAAYLERLGDIDAAMAAAVQQRRRDG